MSSSDWREVNAEDFCKEVTDGTHDSPRKQDSGNYLITSRHLREHYLDFDNAYMISEYDYLSINKRSKVDPWDVIISMIGTVGNVYLERSSRVNYAIKNVGLFKLGGDEVKSKWLYYYLKTDAANQYIKANMRGSTQQYITLKALRQFPILHPTSSEAMAKIANILSSLDEKIEINNRINKNLEEMAQAIFKRWFVDFEFPNEDGKPYKSSGGEMIQSELGPIPKGWEVFQFRDIFKFIKGKKPKIIKIRNFEYSEKYLTIDVLNRNSVLFCLKEKVVKANREDVLMVMDGASSGAIYFGQKGVVASTLAKLKLTNKKISNRFLFYLIKYFENDIKNHTTGSAIPHTDKVYVYKLMIALPENILLRIKIDDFLSDISGTFIVREQENEILKATRDTLLPKLMSGEIRVPLDGKEESREDTG